MLSTALRRERTRRVQGDDRSRDKTQVTWLLPTEECDPDHSPDSSLAFPRGRDLAFVLLACAFFFLHCGTQTILSSIVATLAYERRRKRARGSSGRTSSFHLIPPLPSPPAEKQHPMNRSTVWNGRLSTTRKALIFFQFHANSVT